MRIEEITRKMGVPPAKHPIGIYLGLLIGGIILGIGAIVLLRDVLIEFTQRKISLDTLLIFKIVLLIASSYASLGCFFGLFRMVDLQRAHVKKVSREFKDFITYARPLVEELIKQRIVVEKLMEKIDTFEKQGAFWEEKSEFGRISGGRPRFVTSGREEFLVFVALLGSVSVGLFIYLDRHPWELVPYSVIVLALAWWALIARYFDLFSNIKSYYIPSAFILLMPSLSIILRAFIQPYQVLYVVFFTMAIYVWGTYVYSFYLASGRPPKLLSKIKSRF